MISGIFHKGSGLGNQLHRYVMTRVIALDKGYRFGMQNTFNFKGESFMDLDMGDPTSMFGNPHVFKHQYLEPRVNHPETGDDVRGYDFEGVADIQDETLIDGEFQGEKYFAHHLDEIREWLTPVDTAWKFADDVCVIGFRGGEYVGVPSLFLPKEYWTEAIRLMREINPKMVFHVHTDDLETARTFFPDFIAIHDIETNWCAFRYAKYMIVANSSFYILPTLLNDVKKKVIAPKFWARRSLGRYWALPQNEYEGWQYI